MMYDQDFHEMAREYGLDAREYSGHYTGSYAPRSHALDYTADFDPEFPDDIGEFSSPCPTGRGARYNHTAYMQHGHLPFDPVSEYPEDDDQLHYGELLNSNLSQIPRQVSASYENRPFRNSFGRGASAQAQQNYKEEYHQPEARHYLSGSHSSAHASSSQGQNSTGQHMKSRDVPRNTHGIRLRPVSQLPDVYRAIFKFGVFNTIQSSCFDDIMSSNENMVISAPTGSGKTVLFELAMINMLMESGNDGRPAKCVYMAPTKALCSERYRDWTTKFEGLGIKCCELTGDTVQLGKSAWGDAKNATVIITTGEKWDSLTRHWRDYGQILSQVQLFMVDEVHILNETRGSTLEVVISRMKTRGTSVRFVMVSATVPNIEDIAGWVASRNKSGSAKIFQFGEEFRPCKLTRFVYGVPRHPSQNDWTYATTLDKKLYPVLQQHSVNKPVLVFVSTRKGVFTTAKHLADKYEKASNAKNRLPWSSPSNHACSFHDKGLENLASMGIGVHHAGLSMDDRRLTEDLYMKGILRVIVATSTLAVGVNLPAHTVVIRGVKMYGPDGHREYSDLDIMQMMGRAGRPQFDKDGIAIILCEPELEAKYRDLVQGRTTLESSLHQNLSEHLNSEIGLGTITDIHTAKEWLHNSFLFQRLRRNPSHYAIEKATGQSWQERLEDLVMRSVKALRDSELLKYDEDSENGSLQSTEYGDIMSKFYVRQATMTLVMNMPERANMREMLETISAADEFSDLKLRQGEKTAYNKLLKHDDIRYKLKKVEKASDKVFLLIQAVLGGISLNSPDYRSTDSQPPLDALAVFRHIGRIARVVVEVALVKKHGAPIKHGLELLSCFTAKAWEDRPVVLRQIEQIGDKSIKVLAEHGITTFDALRKQDPLRIETLLNRRPPFGHEVLAFLTELPQYFVNITEQSVDSARGRGPVSIELSIDCGLISDRTPYASKQKKQKSRRGDMTAILTLTSDLDFIDFRRISTKALTTSKTFNITAELTKPSQSISVYMTSENIAGVTVSKVHKPQVDPKEFPVVDTRPLNSLEADLAGLEDDPNFWDMDMFSDEEKEQVKVKDSTRPSDKNVGRTSEQGASRKGVQKSNNSVLESLDQPSFEPKKLKNGNYECNHTCKDKTKCRHFCCRQGVAKPPPPPKRLAHQGTASEKGSPKEQVSTSKNTGGTRVQVCEPGDVMELKQKQKQKEKKPDSRLADLEALHEKTNVANSLKLAQGRRLKLDDSDSVRHTKPKPDFDLDFANLDDDTDKRKMPEAPDDSDDELPDIKDLVHSAPRAKARSSSCEIEISDDPELDAAILQMPSDEARTGKKANTKAASARGRKRESSPVNSAVPVKRQRGVAPARFSSPPHEHTSNQGIQHKSPEPLFLPSDDYDFQAYRLSSPLPMATPPPVPPVDIAMDTGPEEFTLDESLFCITPSASTSTAQQTSSTLDGDSSPKTGYGLSRFSGDTNRKAPVAGKVGILGNNVEKAKEMEIKTGYPEVEEDYDDGLAAFDAWLASGAVEIVPSIP